MKRLLLLGFLIIQYNLFSQCTNWISDDFDSFEYATVCPYIIPGTTFQNTPQQSPGFGPNYSGNYHLYLNFVNGYTGPAFDRTYNVCSGNTYRISFYHRDAWGGQNNTTFNIYDDNNVLLSSDNVPWNGSNWNYYISPEITATTTELRLEIVNNQTTGNNDMIVDDMSLQICSITENSTLTLCSSQTSTINLIDLFSSDMPGGGTWNGPSILINGDQGTFDPAVNIPGTYSYTPGGMSCTPNPSTVDISISSTPNLGPDTTICSGSSLTINAGTEFDQFLWSTGETTENITINTAGTYSVEVGTLLDNIITNGNFNSGNTGFTTDYSPGTGGAWGLLSSGGTYAISTSPSLVHNNFSFCGDHTSGTGNMLIVNGSGTPNTDVWCQTVGVSPGTDYSFSCWAANALNEVNVANLQFSINGIQLGSVFNTTQFACDWQQFSENWNSGINTTADVCILNQNTSEGGNDFAIDDIYFAPFCSAFDTITIDIESPTQVVSVSDPVCNGSSDGEIHIDNALAVEYSFDGGINWQIDSFLVNQPAGSYNVCSKTLLGCEICESMELTDPEQVTIIVSSDTTICENGTAILTASGEGGSTFSYHWDFTGDTNGQQIVNPIGSSTYLVSVENENGCFSETSEILVNVHPPIAGNIIPETSICFGESIVLYSDASGGNGGPYTFSWDNGWIEINIFNSSQEVYIQDTTVFTVTIDDGCESTPLILNTQINVASLPIPELFIAESEKCEPGIFVIDNITDPTFDMFNHWELSNGESWDNQESVTTGELSPGSYDLSFSVTSFNGCRDTTIFENYLTVHNNPVAAFTFNPQPLHALNAEARFINQSTGAVDYFWYFSNGSPSESTEEDPFVHFPSGVVGEYEVILVARSDFGCTDTVNYNVNVLPEVILFAPNAFTPDGDEFNNTWRIYIDGIDVYQYELIIFNRWGEIVFESHNPEETWDGTYNNQPVQDGTYNWILRTKNLYNDEKYTYKGYVSVIKGRRE